LARTSWWGYWHKVQCQPVGHEMLFTWKRPRPVDNDHQSQTVRGGTSAEAGQNQ